MKPSNWKPGHYQTNRSFVWNLFHYKCVDEARIVSYGTSEKIQNVLLIRFIAILFMGCVVLTALTALISW